MSQLKGATTDDDNIANFQFRRLGSYWQKPKAQSLQQNVWEHIWSCRLLSEGHWSCAPFTEIAIFVALHMKNISSSSF